MTRSTDEPVAVLTCGSLAILSRMGEIILQGLHQLFVRVGYVNAGVVRAKEASALCIEVNENNVIFVGSGLLESLGAPECVS